MASSTDTRRSVLITGYTLSPKMYRLEMRVNLFSINQAAPQEELVTR